MDALLTAAAGGLRARIESLDLLANNIANANTAGFKADREFYSTYLAEESLDGPEGTMPVQSPVVEKNWTDFQQGVTIATGSPLDVALAGPGFFALQTANGPVYTRNGNFRLQPDGLLTAASGDSVLNAEGKTIRLDPRQPISIDQTGTIRQGGAIVARLSVTDFEDRSQLQKAGASVFRYDASLPPPRTAISKVEQGRLENANFQPAESAVRLVNVMRQFEMLQKAIALGSEMNRRAIEEVAKI
ncbi:MAG: flagellar hook basal-body protein [Bryobacterales bacterium]|nr:flagellar hook basal-body protein [Bryobacterales bacterium]